MAELQMLGEPPRTAEKYANRMTRASVSRRLFNNKKALEKGLP